MEPPLKEDASQTLARQWTMLRAIPRAPVKVTTAEVATKLHDEGFTISRRSVERDLHTLSSRFPLILDDRTKPYGWSWAKDANFEFMPKLSSSQAVALLLAQAHLRPLLPISMGKDLLPVYDAARTALAASGWKDWDKQTAVVPLSLQPRPPKVSAPTLQAVQSGLARKRCLQALYRTKGGTHPKATIIHPLGLLVRGPVIYLVCTLFAYTDIRQLALHRLSEVNELPETRRQPVGFNLQTYAAGEGALLQSQGQVRLVCRFSRSAAEHLRETPISSDQTLDEIDGGNQVLVTADVENDERLRWWLAGFGSQVEVLEPLSLRASMRDEAERLMAAYAD